MVLNDLRRGFAVYRDVDVPRLVHGLKTALAAVLCMLICMRLELRAPGTAMVSAVIVMLHQQSGMVIARAFYRALGICFGGTAGLVLMCVFAQQPPLFLSGPRCVGWPVCGGCIVLPELSVLRICIVRVLREHRDHPRMVESLRRGDQCHLHRQRGAHWRR
jgi:hypothetical protein